MALVVTQHYSWFSWNTAGLQNEMCNETDKIFCLRDVRQAMKVAYAVIQVHGQDIVAALYY